MKRKFYNELIDWKNNNISTPLMVVGARQIGKTYLIDKFCKENFEDYIYINLLDSRKIVQLFESEIDTEDKINKMKLILNRDITENTVIFFDEIQESEGLISALKYFCENEFEYKIVCAGSLLGVKLKRFSKSFPVGKVTIKYMYPMDFEEFLIAINCEKYIDTIRNCYKNNEKMYEPLHQKLLDYYKLYLCIGGMPAAVQNIRENELNILKFDKNIVNSIVDAYIADMGKYTANNYETIKIEKTYKSVPIQLGKENKKFQYSKVENNARKRDYESSTEWLTSSRLILQSYCINKCETPLKAYINEDSFKLYVSDVGILSALLEIPYNKIMLDENFMYKGAIVENYVATQFLARGYNLYYWTKNQIAEVDFMLETAEGIIPVEVKASDNVTSKSLNYYIKNYNPKYAIRVSSKNFGFENDIKSVPLYATFCICE